MSTAHGFGQRLAALRLHRGYSQEALTRELELPPGTVARWECELESPVRAQLLMLSARLCVAVDEIVGVPDSLALADKQPIVCSLGLRRFLSSAEGKRARQSKLEHALRDLPSELSAEQYGQITGWLLSLGERDRDLR
jgi:transcriptional regulator with XRE-family HTH domain